MDVYLVLGALVGLVEAEGDVGETHFEGDDGVVEWLMCVVLLWLSFLFVGVGVLAFFFFQGYEIRCRV